MLKLKFGQQIRFKRDKAISPQVEKVINQLSVLSAGRKQPRLLSLCDEDYIKHKTVQTAWSKLRKEKKLTQQGKLNKQFSSMEIAMADLKSQDSSLFEIANKLPYGKRFPLELRVPTQFPPRNVWFYDYYPKK